MTPEAETFRKPQESSAIRAGSVAFKLKCSRKCGPWRRCSGRNRSRVLLGGLHKERVNIQGRLHEMFRSPARNVHFPVEPRDGTRLISVLVSASALWLEAFVQQLSPEQRLHVVIAFQFFQTYLY